MSSQQEVFAAIVREREYQDRKWGTLDTYHHSVPDWIDIAGEELLEAYSGQATHPERLAEILQAAAVLVACLEQHGVVERGVLAQAGDRTEQ